MSVAVAVWCAGCAVVFAGIGWMEMTRHAERHAVSLAVAALGGVIRLLATAVAFRNHEGLIASYAALGAMAIACTAGMGIAASRVAFRRLSSAGLLHSSVQEEASEREETE